MRTIPVVFFCVFAGLEAYQRAKARARRLILTVAVSTDADILAKVAFRLTAFGKSLPPDKVGAHCNLAGSFSWFQDECFQGLNAL